LSLESLIPYARRLSQFPADDNAYSNLVVRLQLVSDVAELKLLAQQFMLAPEVAVVIWRRIAMLAEKDPGGLVEAASAFYANGVDAEAIALVTKALEFDDRVIAAWELKAALTPDQVERKQILERILEIEPGNRRAVDNLILMGQR